MLTVGGGKISFRDTEGTEVASIRRNENGTLEFSDVKIAKSTQVETWRQTLKTELDKANPNMKKVARLLAKGILWLYKSTLEE